MGWKRQEKVITLPDGVREVAGKIRTVADATLMAGEVLRDLVETLSSLTVLDLTATQVLVRESVAVIQNTLNDLAKDSGAYLLMVPIARRTPIPAVVQRTLDNLGLKSLPLPDISLAEFGLDTSRLPAHTATALKGLGHAQGGNAGFLRLVCESLLDEGDPARPQLAHTDYVTGLCVLAGADTIEDLTPFISQVRALLGGLDPNGAFERPGLPVPQGLRARVVVGRRPDVLLEWAPQQVLTEVATWDTHALVHQFAVIRIDNIAKTSVHTVQELFGTNKLVPGLTTTDAHVVAVVDIDPLSPRVPRWTYRDGNEITPNEERYYAVSYNVKVGGTGDLMTGDGRETGFNTLSSVERVRYDVNANPQNARATAPDWIRTPSCVGLIPPLQGLLNEAVAYVEQWGSTASGHAELLKEYVAWLSEEILRYERFAARIANSVKLLTQITDGEYKAGVYTRRLETSEADVLAGNGGTAFVVNEIAQALTASDAPPFQRGEEFVTGFIVIAAAPSLGALEPAKRALNTIFAASDEQKQAWDEAMEQLGDVVEEAERRFGDELLPDATGVIEGPAGPAGSSIPSVGAADPGWQPIDTTPRVFAPNLAI
jgi:hypothetical protein